MLKKYWKNIPHEGQFRPAGVWIALLSNLIGVILTWMFLAKWLNNPSVTSGTGFEYFIVFGVAHILLLSTSFAASLLLAAAAYWRLGRNKLTGFRQKIAAWWQLLQLTPFISLALIIAIWLLLDWAQ